VTEPHRVFASPPPRLPDEAVAGAAERFGLRGALTPLDAERDQNLRIDDPDEGRFLIKVSNAAEHEAVVDCETEAVLHVHRVDPDLRVALPRRLRGGGWWTTAEDADGTPHFVRAFEFLEGQHAEPAALTHDAMRDWGETLGRLGRAMRGFFHPAADRPLLWDARHASDLRPFLADVEDPLRRNLAAAVLDRFEREVKPRLPTLPAQAIHNDLTVDNALVDVDGRIVGIFDFGDMTFAPLAIDVASAAASTIAGRPDPFEAAVAFLEGYERVAVLGEDERDLLGDLLAVRFTQNVLISAWRAKRFPDNVHYIAGVDDESWDMLQELSRLGPQETRRRLRGETPAPSVPTDEEVHARRLRVMGTALSSLTYTRPLHLVRGEGPWLVDAAGDTYLDAYNNVPVVGHAHPRVVEAIARQARLLNSNMRYLHEAPVALAERLLATLPEGFDVCMFVNSGSEANDLAWRLATTATGRSGGVVTEWAYHGISSAIADLSPEVWPDRVKPDHVETIPAPDGDLGPYRSDEPGWAERYAAHLDDAVAALAERGHGLAAVYVDAAFTSDGILAPPAGYHRELVRRVHGSGGLFVADEVQSGHGRFGDHLWGFQAFDVVPDVVTLGKPMGNGHPVAAVLTRSDIVDRFAARTEFFSTFGGNPVACAAGLAVLDVLEDGVRARAAGTGRALREALGEAAGDDRRVAVIRGRGLLAGVALVEAATGEPDAVLAGGVQDGMRDRGVLIGTTGRHGNVLKIRPPLAFGPEHVGLVAEAFAGALGDATT
jgi:4-aminobutyrate aminotransferase-like enzyme